MVQILLDFFDGQISFFQERSIEISSSFFALQSVRQDASIQLSNSTIWWFSIFTLVRGDPFDLEGVRALHQGDGLVKNGFRSVLLGPYGILHAYKCKEKKILIFSFLATAIRGTLYVEWCAVVIVYFCLEWWFIRSHGISIHQQPWNRLFPHHHHPKLTLIFITR